MKIGVLHIIREHIGSLKNEGSDHVSVLDILVFFAVPSLLSLAGIVFSFEIEKDFFGVSVSVFSVFSALLLNTQIAVFSIFGRSWEKTQDPRSQKDTESRRKTRDLLIKEVNSNISYLIIVSIFSLISFCIMYAASILPSIETAVTIFLYSHFTLTAMMIVKRSHALFSNEYDTT